MSITEQEAESLAEVILSAAKARAPIPPITGSRRDFDLEDAYRVSAAIAHRRFQSGERPVGWKIGFTNSAIWADQGLDAPIWGPMYGTTVASAAADATFPIGTLVEPRIEPEIGLRLRHVPHPDMDDIELIGCVDAVTHGFEIVQSVYPGWKLKPPDAVAAFGMHGAYRHGQLVQISGADRTRWLKVLADFTVILFRDGVEMDRGAGKNVLGGPISALGYLVRGLSENARYSLKPGDLITTGTLTKAMPVALGETWTTVLSGIPLPPMKIVFS